MKKKNSFYTRSQNFGVKGLLLLDSHTHTHTQKHTKTHTEYQGPNTNETCKFSIQSFELGFKTLLIGLRSKILLYGSTTKVQKVLHEGCKIHGDHMSHSICRAIYHKINYIEGRKIGERYLNFMYTNIEKFNVNSILIVINS